MKYKLPITIVLIENGDYMARCDNVRAIATGNSADEAVRNLYGAILELVKEFGEGAVFQDVIPGSDIQVLDVAI